MKNINSLRSMLLLSLIFFWIGLVSFHMHPFSEDAHGVNYQEYSSVTDHFLSEEGTCIFNITRNSELFSEIIGFPISFPLPVDQDFVNILTTIDISPVYLNLRSERAPPFMS